MVSELGLDVDIVELDTQLFFRSPTRPASGSSSATALNLIVPEVITIAEQHKREGPNLWETNPDRCCHIRKVEPLIRALEPYDAWVSGIRREQSPSRAGVRKVERSERYGVWKIQPLADWSEKDVWRYIVQNDIPYNPLHDVGYRSIGCIPCTRPTRPDEEERAGRWAGSDKLECGIHVEQQGHLKETTVERQHLRARASRVRPRRAAAASRSGSRGSRAPASPRSRTSSARRSTSAATSSSTSTATRSGRTSRRASGSRRRTATRTSSGSAGSPRASPATAAPSSRAAISPYVETRQKARELVEQFGPFVEVYVNASVEECARRDVNGLYAKAYAGEIKGFTGVDDPYEAPESPEIVVDTEAQSARGERRGSSSPGSRSSGSSAPRSARERRHDRPPDPPARRRARAARRATRPDDVDSLETVTLTARELADLDMLASGALSPLTGFMGSEDYERVVESMRLAQRASLGAAGLPVRRRGAARATASRSPTRAAVGSPCSRSTRSTPTTRSARPSSASARPTASIPASRGSTRRTARTSPAR